MGGAIGEGNVTPSAEFNIWADPEAAHRVFHAGLNLTMVGLDVTHRAMLSAAQADALRAHGKAGAVVADITHGPCRGRTVVDRLNRLGAEANADVAMDVNAAGFIDLLTNRIASLP